MNNHRLYSIILELRALETTSLQTTTGHLTHALFLDLIAQADLALATRLHDEPEYRPFTVSSLMDASTWHVPTQVQAGGRYGVRITLLDGGAIWECLTRRLLEERTLRLRVQHATFELERLLSTSATDPLGWVAHTTWQELSSVRPGNSITLLFDSPTAFSLGDRRFGLFPEPMLVWDSLMRTWNRFAPELLRIDKAPFREFVTNRVIVADYALRTTMLRFPKFSQVGFMGSCTYFVKAPKDGNDEEQWRIRLMTLAQFARYAGIGYKTTMGMGQARIELR